MRPADFGPFVPVDAQPAEAVQDRRERRLDVPLLIGVVDPQQELPAVLPGEQPVEQRRAHAADVQVAGRTGGETGANGHETFAVGAGESVPISVPAHATAGKCGRCEIRLFYRHFSPPICAACNYDANSTPAARPHRAGDSVVVHSSPLPQRARATACATLVGIVALAVMMQRFGMSRLSFGCVLAFLWLHIIGAVDLFVCAVR